MKYTSLKKIVSTIKSLPAPKVRMYKIIFPLLIVLNLIGFAFGIKVFKNNISNQGQQSVKIITFDRVSYDILQKLTNRVSGADVYFFEGESLESIERLSFFRKNKFLTANAVFIFDPKHALQNYLFNQVKQEDGFVLQKGRNNQAINVYNIFNFLNTEDVKSKIINQGFLVDDAFVKSFYNKFYIRQNFIILATKICDILAKVDPVHSPNYHHNLYTMQKDLDGFFVSSQGYVSKYNHLSVGVLVFGENVATLLRSIGFKDFIFLNLESGTEEQLKARLSNAKNIIKSRQIRCVINSSGTKFYELESLAKASDIKYQNFDFEEDFDIEKYKIISKAVERCFAKK
jgi:hypothetical protein